MIKFDILTLFPELFAPFFEILPYKKAIRDGIATYNIHNIRDRAVDKHGSVDDKPYGGGKGMIIRPEPIFETVESISKGKNTKIILLSPKGKLFDQNMAKDFSGEKHLIIISGRYEGIDARVEQHLATDVVSVGNFVLSGGELPALVIIEAITRILPGILEKEATENESFEKYLQEHPQYTRPANYRGMEVPEILQSGHHKKIEEWKEEQSINSI